jgi:hypothetical protein
MNKLYLIFILICSNNLVGQELFKGGEDYVQWTFFRSNDRLFFTFDVALNKYKGKSIFLNCGLTEVDKDGLKTELAIFQGKVIPGDSSNSISFSVREKDLKNWAIHINKYSETKGDGPAKLIS